jgi:hypothetical protein
LVLLVGCAGTRHLDPPPAPVQIIPNVGVPAEPPPEGTSRVLFDVVDGPSLIQIKTLRPEGAFWNPLCTTPCAADVPAGQHDLSFQLKSDPGHGDSDLLTVLPGTSVYRRSLGERSTSPGLLMGGYLIGYTGLTVLLMSALVTALEGTNDHAGRNTAMVGLSMTIIGGGMFYEGWPTEQPGSVTQFGLAPRR